MHHVGDIYSNRHPITGESSKYIWRACEVCGKEKGVPLWKWKKGKLRMCQPCFASKHSFFSPSIDRRKGKNNHWKGGFKKTFGYVLKRVYTTDRNYKIIESMVTGQKYILLHRYVMAVVLGRPLGTRELVHHLDGNRSNNKLGNLQLTDWHDHDLSYKGGYERGYQDGIKYAQSLNKTTVSHRWMRDTFKSR